MVSSDLKQGYSYNFEVIKEKCERKKFKVKTEDGIEYSVSKFKFQYDQTIPDKIQCYVKQLSPSIILAQDISVFINNFYENGKEYEFTVNGYRKDPEIQYEIQDNYGLNFKLFNPSLSLSKGDRVKCRIIKIKDSNVTLRYVGTLSPKFPLEFYSIEKWLSLLKIRTSPKYYYEWLKNLPEFESAMIKYDEKDPSWILECLQICANKIPQWLIDCKDELPQLRNINRKMEFASNLALYILEESDYLKSCNQEQRITLQSKLSNYVELFEQYSRATSKILGHSHEEFIDRMFRRLKEAGYLYKPSRQIRIMMTILKLRPELINGRMGELFETLHNWDISNWQADPFRQALLEQLQIFIEEHYGKVNLLASDDTSSDNKVISRLILSLAVQRLLAIEKDNIDFNLNRAILYRYTSYLIQAEVDKLLQKSIEALLGYEWPNEYSWEDTEKPMLLFNKICASSDIDYDKDQIIKTYSTSKADILLHKDKIQIIAKGADPEDTVIPNNMFDWLDPHISLADELTMNFGKKNKQMRDYKALWDEIRWSIFGTDDSEITHIEKRFPSNEEEEVKIIIDDIRIVDGLHEKQRLQFHCTIQDDYFYGEGWMPCDNYHLVPWLSYKDIPANYDGTLKFAHDENGSPLFFKAKVRNNKGELIFSLREVIDNHLLDTSFTGQEIVGIVTAFDKANNVWICLAENGASYKVAYDINSADLSIGKIIRITHYERDKSSINSQFFIGSLSPDQNDLPLTFNKNTVLINLMNVIGETPDDDENFKVEESQQVMTQEELLELIYILRRKAYSETEYVKAYNYLGLASILVRFLDDNPLLNELTVHMHLLELLHDFGKNRKVDINVLESYRRELPQSTMLERLYTRLKIVADLDVNDNTRWLWEIRQNPRNEMESSLSSLVLSYNLLPKDLESSRKQILNQISVLLNVNNTTITSKYYGDESQTVEFKSSLIFSPKEGMKAAPKEQMREITHIICGFMNARGGKLFIGVNDAGYENGLNDDLTYRKSVGLKATIDAMIVDLQNHLDRTLPPHAKDHWEIYSDTESKKGVIVVEILPVKQPVEFENTIFVRSSCVTKPRLNEEREEFIKNRSHNYDKLMKLWGIDLEKNDTKNEEESSLQTISFYLKSDNNEEEKKDNSEKNQIKKTVRTGKHRRNVLHAHEEFYAEPAFYLYVNSDGTYFLSDIDRYREEDDDCLLVLALQQDETDGFLEFSYSDGNVNIIPISSLREKPYDQRFELRKNITLENINIIKNENYLLSILKSSNGSLFYRIDSLENLNNEDFLSVNGKSLCDLPHKIILQDVVKKDKLSFFNKESINKDNKTYGWPVPVNISFSEEDRIKELLTPIIFSE